MGVYMDIMLDRLMGDIPNTKHGRMMERVGDSRGQAYPHLFVDADFVGDIDTQRSTSGFHSVVCGANTSLSHIIRQQETDLRVVVHP